MTVRVELTPTQTRHPRHPVAGATARGPHLPLATRAHAIDPNSFRRQRCSPASPAGALEILSGRSPEICRANLVGCANAGSHKPSRNREHPWRPSCPQQPNRPTPTTAVIAASSSRPPVTSCCETAIANLIASSPVVFMRCSDPNYILSCIGNTTVRGRVGGGAHLGQCTS